MKKLFQRLLRGAVGKSSARNSSDRLRVRLHLEELQSRTMLSVPPVSLSSSGQLLIIGSTANDTVHVSETSSAAGQKVAVDYDRHAYSFDAAKVKQIVFQ